MKKFYKYLLVMVLPVFFIYFSFPSGSPGGKTGSIGDNGETCVECHSSFDVISKTGWITTDIPDVGYTPGETYTITATGEHEMVVNFGFELTAENEDGDKTGMFTITDESETKLTNNNNAVTHTSSGIMPDGDSKTWSMEWTAPTESTGNIIFYAAFNAGNGAVGSNGDQIYTTSLNVKQATVGTGEELLAKQLLVYPNPSADFINLELPQGSEYRIIDVAGHVMMTKLGSSTKERLDVSAFKNGIYFIQVMHDDNAATMRFLKN